jgi:hypothetical protein
VPNCSSWPLPAFDLVAALFTAAAPRDLTIAHDQAAAVAARHSRSHRAFSLVAKWTGRLIVTGRRARTASTTSWA